MDSVLLTALRDCHGSSWTWCLEDPDNLGTRSVEGSRKKISLPCLFIDESDRKCIGKVCRNRSGSLCNYCFCGNWGELGSFGKLLVLFVLCSSRKEKYWQVGSVWKRIQQFGGYNTLSSFKIWLFSTTWTFWTAKRGSGHKENQVKELICSFISPLWAEHDF